MDQATLTLSCLWWGKEFFFSKYPNLHCKIEREARYLTWFCRKWGLMVTLPKYQNDAEELVALRGVLRLGPTHSSTSYLETRCLRNTCT